MSRPEHFEMLVLGSGEGGKYLAWHMAKSGHRTAVVERKLIGGSCPNANCLPSKNEIWSAKVADLVRHADRFGIVTGSTVTADGGLFNSGNLSSGQSFSFTFMSRGSFSYHCRIHPSMTGTVSVTG